VGVYDDDTVNLARGDGHPILTLNERVLSVLAMRYVDEVIIGAPWELNREICSSLGCKLVVQDHHNVDAGWGNMSDPNSYAKDAGIYQIINTGLKFNSNT
jgi:ethanolamine-phosphate cytidylyltransferase